jgi:hypothetical protein
MHETHHRRNNEKERETSRSKHESNPDRWQNDMYMKERGKRSTVAPRANHRCGNVSATVSGLHEFELLVRLVRWYDRLELDLDLLRDGDVRNRRVEEQSLILLSDVIDRTADAHLQRLTVLAHRRDRAATVCIAVVSHEVLVLLRVQQIRCGRERGG